MKKILGREELATINSQLHQDNKKIVLAGGCFDLLHPGHKEFLQRARKEGDVLFILLESDRMVKKRKGLNRPYQSEQDRAKNLLLEESVSFVTILPQEMTDNDYDKFVSELKPAIIATTKGDPYRFHKERQAKLVGAKVIDVIERLPEYSTSQELKHYENK